MLPDGIPNTSPTPLDLLEACSNLVHLLDACAEEEAVLRRNGVRITPLLCLTVVTELRLVAGLLGGRAGRDLLAASGRFTDTPTTRQKAPNPAVAHSLRLARSVATEAAEAVAAAVRISQPEAAAAVDYLLGELRILA